MTLTLGGDSWDQAGTTRWALEPSANPLDTQAEANAGCSDPNLAVVSPANYMTGGITMELSGTPPTRTQKTAAGLKFLQGGNYRLCYSQDGSFLGSQVDVYPVYVKVDGAFDTKCIADGKGFSLTLFLGCFGEFVV